MKYLSLITAIFSSLGLFAQYNTITPYASEHNLTLSVGAVPDYDSKSVSLGYEYLLQRSEGSPWRVGMSVQASYFDLPDGGFLTFEPAMGLSGRFVLMRDISGGRGHNVEIQAGGLIAQFIESKEPTGGFAAVIGYRFCPKNSPISIRLGAASPEMFYFGLAFALAHNTIDANHE